MQNNYMTTYTILNISMNCRLIFGQCKEMKQVNGSIICGKKRTSVLS